MVEVFKTNIDRKKDAERMLITLSLHFPKAMINFDLDDADNILRVAGDSSLINMNQLMSVVEEAGFAIEVLEDFEPVSR